MSVYISTIKFQWDVMSEILQVRKMLHIYPMDFAVRKGHFHGPLAPQAPRDSHSLGAASPRSPVSGCPHHAPRVADALGLPEPSTGFFF